MVDKKVSGLTEVTSLADNDVLSVVDVSDQTMSTSGTNVKITKSNLFTGYETTTQLNTRDNNNRNRVNHTGTQPLSSIVIPDNSISESKLLNYQNFAFTPSFLLTVGGTPPGVVYEYQIGRIFRRDSLLFVTFRIKWTALTSGTVGIVLAGMPRALNVDSLLRYPAQIVYNSLNLPTNNDLFAFIQDGASNMSLLFGTNNIIGNTITADELSSSGEISGTVLYPNGS